MRLEGRPRPGQEGRQAGRHHCSRRILASEGHPRPHTLSDSCLGRPTVGGATPACCCVASVYKNMVRRVTTTDTRKDSAFDVAGAAGIAKLDADTDSLTKCGPHWMLTWLAAAAYVWLIGCVLLPV